MTAVLAAAELNRAAAEAMQDVGVSGATDVTGFGLMGHLHEMVLASGVSARIEAASVPIHDGAVDLAKIGIIPAAHVITDRFCRII